MRNDANISAQLELWSGLQGVHEASVDALARAAVGSVLVVGASGALGKAFEARCKARQLPCVVVGRDMLDASDAQAVERLIRQHRPAAIINAAGARAPSPGSMSPGEAEAQCRAHIAGTVVLATAAARHGLVYQVISSAAVLAGVTGRRDESAVPAPLDAFGRCQAEAESRALRANPQTLLVRSGQFFGPDDDAGLLGEALASLRDGEPVALSPELTLAPAYTPDLVDACLDLAADGEQGIWHLYSDAGIPAVDLVGRAATLLGLGTLLVQHDVDNAQPAPVLETRRNKRLPALDYALERFVAASRGATLERRGASPQGCAEDAA
ncbi:MAG TPA: sugar nucleotide-binding protein [Pseudoduganella sp.]|jgi:dTDP-4-dehydrorhamnose reductase